MSLKQELVVVTMISTALTANRMVVHREACAHTSSCTYLFPSSLSMQNFRDSSHMRVIRGLVPLRMHLSLFFILGAFFPSGCTRTRTCQARRTPKECLCAFPLRFLCSGSESIF